MTGRSNSSAIWAAQRIPPDHVAAVANTFTIRHLNLSDTDNNLYSHGVTQLAEEKGWWVPQSDKPEIFDFFGSYGYQVNFTDRRMWRIFSLLSPEEGAKLNPATNVCDPFAKDVFPASVPAPRGSVTLEKVMNVFRDHYEGTPFDLTKACGLHNGSLNFSACHAEAKRNRQASMWFGYDAPHGTVYLPFYGTAVEGAPDSYHSSEGHMSKFSTKVAWWAFNLINQYTDLNFALINKEVRQKASTLEKVALQQSYRWEDDAAKMASSGRDGPAAAAKHLTKKSNEFASEVVAEWWDFAWMLIAKYGRYSVTFNESETGALGQVYPAWWLRNPEVGYTAFTPKGPNTGRNVTESRPHYPPQAACMAHGVLAPSMRCVRFAKNVVNVWLCALL
ncbi:pipD [Symbiodinium sp. KB8]|nr:pipD [Symbiodinium sp. KB8]